MKLSIITINWNDEAGLRKTIESVLGQTARKELEYIVIDGASTDGSPQVLEEYGDRIDRWVSEPDSGIYNAMNKGVRMSTGEYLLFMNSGDTLYNSTVVETLLPELESGEDIVTGKMLYSGKGRYSQADDPITLLFLYQSSLPHDATFIRRQLLIDTPYDESLRIASDWKFFVQVIVQQNCSYKIVDHVVSEFDTHGISAKNRDLCKQERDKALDELFPPRVLADYFRFTKGEGYQGSEYDRFYVKLRDYQYGRVLYNLNVWIMHIVARFNKKAQWAENYQIRRKK